MFDKLRAQKAIITDQAKDFLLLWKAFKAETTDRVRAAKLALRVDTEWLKLSQDQKDALWIEIFPEHAKVKDIFGAKIVSINAGEFKPGIHNFKILREVGR